MFVGVPFGSGYPLYLFCFTKTKKDAAAIPNAEINLLFRSNDHRVSIILIKPNQLMEAVELNVYICDFR